MLASLPASTSLHRLAGFLTGSLEARLAFAAKDEKYLKYLEILFPQGLTEAFNLPSTSPPTQPAPAVANPYSALLGYMYKYKIYIIIYYDILTYICAHCFHAHHTYILA